MGILSGTQNHLNCFDQDFKYLCLAWRW